MFPLLVTYGIIWGCFLRAVVIAVRPHKLPGRHTFTSEIMVNLLPVAAT